VEGKKPRIANVCACRDIDVASFDESASQLIRALATEAHRITAVEQLVDQSVGPIGDGDAIINFDTVLLHFDQTREFWFDQLLLRWADVGRALSEETRHRAFHRFVFVPTLRDLKRLSPLDHLTHSNVIQLTLHMQLWFGAVCHIVPVPQMRLPEFSSQWSSYMRNARIMFRAPDYYMDGYSEFHVLKDETTTEPRIERMARELRQRTVATLAYTSEHFEKGRIGSGRWRNIRAFMSALYPRCLAPGCRSNGETHVDHIFPIGPQANPMGGRANSSLINLRQLCASCNLRRRKQGYDYDPYQRFFTEIVPRHYQTPDVLRIITDRPPWLGGAFDAPWRERLEALF
jgi:5-methylcytosine-specific restriction endonuclease McrA